MATLYLMMGYPGAGKTTTAKVISEQTGAIHLSSDQTRLDLFKPPAFSQSEHDTLYAYLDSKTEELLQEGKDVIYDANLNRFIHRQDKYEICDRTGARAKLIWVHTAKEIARNRATHIGRFPLVPSGESAEQMFERITNIIEVPSENEPYFSIDGTSLASDEVTKIIEA